MRPASWKAYLAAAASVAVVYFIVPKSAVSKLLLYNGVGLTAVVAIFLGIKRNVPAQKRPWLLIALGQVSFLTADVVYYVLEATTGTTPFPSPADLFYLSMYPFLIAGLLGLLRELSPGRDWASLVDATLVAVATFAVLGILVMDTYIADPHLDLAGRLISLAYPVMDVMVLAVAARLLTSMQLRNPSFALLAAGITSLLVADTIYGVLNSAGAFKTGGFADAFWLGFYALLGAAAMNPAMAHPPVARPVIPGRITKARVIVLCVVTLTVPVIDLIWGEPFDKLLTTLSSGIMFLLVQVRLMGLMRILQQREEQARHNAAHDSLTGLANRVLFADRLAELIATPKPSIAAVLFVDLDDFKTVNDSMGHHAGDELLTEVSRRLASCVRPADTVARLGGDEFAVLLASAVDRQDAVATAHRVLGALNAPIELQGREVMISASVGIAVEPRHKASVDLLLRCADAAMYVAKEKGKGRFEFFEQQGRTEAVDRLEMRRDLQLALDREEFEVYYQPILDMETNEIRAVEALLRWHHPKRGIIAPDRFVSIAEQSGLIVPIGRWVLRQATTQVQRWTEEFGRSLGVSVNLSVRQLHHPGFLEDVAEALRLSGLEPEQLTLEITESMLIADTERAARALAQLKVLRVRIAIDDFGTGYSSLSYLRRFPFDTIKIDRSFVSELVSSATSEALVRTVIDLARNLDMATVAEGIEDERQWQALRGLACGAGQGYYFSRPVDCAGLAALLTGPAPALPPAEHAQAPAAPALPPADTVAPLAAAAPAKVTAAKRSGDRRSRRPEVEIHEGDDALVELRADLDELHDALALPLMARVRWLGASADVYPEWTPRVFVVRERGRGQIAGAALLGLRHHDGVAELVSLGHGTASATYLPVRAQKFARPLANAIAADLHAAGQATLDLQQLPASDPVAKIIATQLRATRHAELPIPKLTLPAGTSSDELLSRNLRRQLRKAHNRLESDGVGVTITFERSHPAIEAMIVELEDVHRQRDHASGRTSDLDDVRVSRLWRELILRHSRAGCLEVGTIRLDGKLAGFVVALIDGPAYRVFDGHFATEFARYSPGRIVEAAAVDQAIADPAVTEIDWMSGVAADKILAANGHERRWRLLAAVGGASVPVADDPAEEMAEAGLAEAS